MMKKPYKSKIIKNFNYVSPYKITNNQKENNILGNNDGSNHNHKKNNKFNQKIKIKHNNTQ